MNLPAYTQVLLHERYRPEVIKDWRAELRRRKAERHTSRILDALTDGMKPFELSFSHLFPLHRPRPEYPPLSALTLRLLEELYGGHK